VALGSDRRRYPRWQTRFPVRFRLLGKPSVYVGSLSRDISAGGVKIIADQFVPKNATLEVEIFLENVKRLVPAHARVVWLEQLPYGSDSFRLGLEFNEINPRDRQYLQRLVSEYSSN